MLIKFSKRSCYTGYMLTQSRLRQGFALPSVVIASVVLFMILVTVVGTISSARVALDAQFDEARLRDAAESGAARAQDCIANSTMVLNALVTPATNCDGSAVVPARSAYMIDQGTFRSSYEIKLTDNAAQSKKVAITGKIDELRASGGVAKSRTLPLTQNAIMTLDPAGDRPSQRWWYFGTRVVMDFGTSGSDMPTFSYNAGSSSPAPDAAEGTTVVSDQNGNLVFWTNGLQIWDKTGAIMQNSTGMTGAASATQAVASFPMNTARTKYGIVSNSGQGETGYGELYFSIVDMTLNGGNGAVTTKNVKLGTGTGYSGEGLNAMPKGDGSGYYVYAFNAVMGKISYFLIKNDGTIQTFTPITMNPAPLICYQGTGGFAGYGSVNFTKDYQRMILMQGSWKCDGTNGGGANDSGRAYLYEVDTSTGGLTLTASWITSGWTGTVVGTHGGYTADFSPQEKYVYVGQIYPGNAIRYDISSNDSTTIKNSQWVIGFDTLQTDANQIYQNGAHIRQGPDGRMWIANRTFKYYSLTPCKMGYISAPDSPINSKASIGFSPDAITLPAGSCSQWGLPQVATVFKPKIVLY
jgi:hypothetical protein